MPDNNAHVVVSGMPNNKNVLCVPVHVKSAIQPSAWLLTMQQLKAHNKILESIILVDCLLYALWIVQPVMEEDNALNATMAMPWTEE